MSKKKIIVKKLPFFSFLWIKILKIATFRFFQILKGTFPENLKSLGQKMKEKIDF